MFLVRYSPTGTLDPSFGEGGSVNLPPSQLFYSWQIAAEGGKVVVALTSNPSSAGGGRPEVRRYGRDGHVDESFGQAGSVVVGGFLEGVKDIEIQPDGKILLLTDESVVRLTRTGDLDAEFGGGDGIVESPVFGVDVLIQPDGRVIVAGSDGNHIAVARLDPNGSLDLGFGGSDGVAEAAAIGDTFGSNAVALQESGRIVVASTGRCGSCSLSYAMTVGFTPEGRLDSSFGNRGTARLDPKVRRAGRLRSAQGLTVRPDGHIVLVGEAGTPSGQIYPRLGAVQLSPAGRIIGRYVERSTEIFFAGVGVQPGGRVIGASNVSKGPLALVGLGPALRPDRDFGGGDGLVFAPEPFPAHCRRAIANAQGTTKKDRIVGTSFGDVMAGRQGNDTIVGRGGEDLVCGGSGADTILGGPGNDLLLGGPGRDSCFGGHGHDRAVGCEPRRS